MEKAKTRWELVEIELNNLQEGIEEGDFDLGGEQTRGVETAA